MDLKEVVYTFIERKDMKKLEFKGGKPASLKVKLWRILQKYEKETKTNLNIAISIKEDCTILRKEVINPIFIMKDGRKLHLSELNKEEEK